jgi:hypothetical protein
MSNCFQALSLPEKGSLREIGPVKVDWKYPTGHTKTGNIPKWDIDVTDASGSIKLTLWKTSAALQLVQGGTYIFSGDLVKTVYNGVPNIGGSNITAKPVDGSQGASSAPTRQSGGFSPQQEVKIDHVELAGQMADFVVEFEQALIARKIDPTLITNLLARVIGTVPEWWFGAKQLKMANQSPVEEEPPNPF